ncbi:DUF4145 domain-containing protein [Pseudomonas putida]|uniref:DUF4145 domain-containing protein n=1 Tax=Pseudomonas putida TaxID=303 RepID=UPI003905DCBC
MAKAAPIWSHCNRCARDTKHDCLKEVAQSFEDSWNDEYDYQWGKVSKLVQCRGCEEISLRVDWWHSEYDASDDTDFYPPRVSRQPPRWKRYLPDEWQSMMAEIYSALHANSRRLAMMGARTIVDMYMNHVVGDIGGFIQKLNQLVKAGHLGKLDKEVLEAALEAGHAASHRGHLPSSADLNHVMDIVENLLQKHALAKSAVALKMKTPPRVKAAPAVNDEAK